MRAPIVAGALVSLLLLLSGRAQASAGFDLAAAQRGYAAFGAGCASCHAMSALAPVDLLGLGFSRDQLRTLLARQDAPAAGATGATGATGAAPAPDLSRWMIAQPDATARLRRLLAAGHGQAGAPAASPARDGDIVTFLAWVAEPHLTGRRRLGVQIGLFMVLLIVLLRRATKRGTHDARRPGTEGEHHG